MVDMGMGQDDGVDLAAIERESPVVQLLLALGTLEHPAVDKDTPAVCLKAET